MTEIITAFITAITTFLVMKYKHRAEDNAVKTIKELLSHPEYTKRNFAAVKRRIRGFEDDELRRLLVRAGAVAFRGKQDAEFWGLTSRNAINQDLNK